MATIKDRKGIVELVHQMSELKEPGEIWSHFLDSVKKITNSHSSFLQQNDLRIEHQPLLISNGVDRNLIDQYLSHYYSTDIWAGAVLENTQGTFHNIQQLVDQKTYLASELFNDLQRYQQSYYAAGLQLTIRNQTGIMLTFHRDKTQGAFDSDDILLLNNLIPVLYETLWRISDNYLLTTENSGATAYIDTEFKIVDANSSFYDVCSQSDEITIIDDRFCISDANTAEINDGFRELFYTNKSNKKAENFEINLYDEFGDIRHNLTLTPCHNRVTRFGFRVQGLFARLEIKSYQCLKVCWERIKEFYALTPAELSVLKLVNRALSRKEIAQKRNCSPETVKTQISALERKLKAKNQVELIRNIRSHSYYFEDS